jgi:hypothetical protein
MKNERLKRLESELEDLEKWMSLGLVPKKDTEKHREEMKAIRGRIQEERDRLRLLKESGDLEEMGPPKRGQARPAYSEPQTLPEIEIGDGLTDAGLDMETEAYDMETAFTEEETEGGGSGEEDEDGALKEETEDEEDPFSDRNRWKRGILEDPESESW